ncbi:MAG: glycosyl transferase group 1 [Daejeonella sp.]|nr:glycosyl transferase group 1 [Daejeonella sp.]
MGDCNETRSKSILFFGELPPRTVHGASISSKINVQILSKYYKVICIEEYSSLEYHEQNSFKKIIGFCSSYFLFIQSIYRNKFNAYYGVLYLSSFGIIKNLLLIIFFSLFNRNSKIILHFHRSDFNCFYQNQFNKLIFRILQRFTNKFILLSEKQFNEMPLPRPQKVVLLNSIQEYGYTMNSKPVDNGVVKAVFIGNFIREKGIFLTIDAVKKYNSINYKAITLICYGNYTTSSVSNEIQGLLDDNISVKIHTSEEAKWIVLQQADVLILPSYNEGMPLVLLEAMYIGKPVIITNVGYVEEALGMDYELYCEVGNSNSIITAFDRFERMDKEELSRTLKVKYNKFNLGEHEDKLLDIFRNVLEYQKPI